LAVATPTLEGALRMGSERKKSPQDLRCVRWLRRDDRRMFGHRSHLRHFGPDRSDWPGKPVMCTS
jgi:hypothetical protein